MSAPNSLALAALAARSTPLAVCALMCGWHSLYAISQRGREGEPEIRMVLGLRTERGPSVRRAIARFASWTMLLEMAAEEANGESYWQAIVEADEPVRAHRSVGERSLLLGSTDRRPTRSPNVAAEATSGLLSPFFVTPVRPCSSRP